MNDTLKVLETRRSCRNFKPDMIPEETLEQIVRAGTYAPTGMGKQSPISDVVAFAASVLDTALSVVSNNAV